MQKVDKEQYIHFIDLAKENTCNTVYSMSVAEGFQSGDIYTDCIENPTFALFWHVSGFAYLSGRPDEKYLDNVKVLYIEDGDHSLEIQGEPYKNIDILKQVMRFVDENSGHVALD